MIMSTEYQFLKVNIFLNSKEGNTRTHECHHHKMEKQHLVPKLKKIVKIMQLKQNIYVKF